MVGSSFARQSAPRARTLFSFPADVSPRANLQLSDSSENQQVRQKKERDGRSNGAAVSDGQKDRNGKTEREINRFKERTRGESLRRTKKERRKRGEEATAPTRTSFLIRYTRLTTSLDPSSGTVNESHLHVCYIRFYMVEQRPVQKVT